jgi:hypothetical protein
MSDNRNSLWDVIAAFKQAEAELGRVIDADEIEQVRIAELRLSQEHSAICRYPSQTAAELSAQLRFLLDRLIKQTGVSDDCLEYREICDILTNRLETLLGTPHDRLAAAAGGSTSPQATYLDPLDSLSVSEIVSRTSDRVSIIGTDYRYIRTSIGNADFYHTEQDRLIGKHVGEVIGSTRFETRARARFDACFNGALQDYSHALEMGSEYRVMNCRMAPVRDRHNVLVGAQVTMRDVTSFYLGEADLMPCG